jgi:hypothetical protein
MAKHYCIPLESPSEWRDALRGIKYSFAHTWEHCYAMHLTTKFKTFLYCFQSDSGKIVCPIAEREYDGYVDIVKPFGFSGFVGNGDCLDFPYHWNEFVRNRRYVCGYLGLNPIFKCSTHFDPNEIHQYDTVHVLDLTRDLDDLWARLDTNRKRQLKGGDSDCSDFFLDKPTLIDFFLVHYADFLRRKRAAEFYFFSQSTLSFLLNLENVLIVGVPNSERVEAVCVFAYTADAGDYLFNVSLPEGKKYTVPLLWYGVKYLKSLQIPVLNLGGGGSGVADFKRRFGGRELALECIKQVYEPETYAKMCKHAQVDPDDKTSYFPAYRKGT